MKKKDYVLMTNPNIEQEELMELYCPNDFDISDYTNESTHCLSYKEITRDLCVKCWNERLKHQIECIMLKTNTNK